MLRPEKIYLFSGNGSGLFPTEQSYLPFLQQLSTDCAPYFHVLAYCLLPDRYEILVETTAEVQWEQYMKQLGLLDKKFAVFDEPAGMMVMSGLVMRIIKEKLQLLAGEKAISPTFQPIAENDISRAVKNIHQLPLAAGQDPSLWKYSSLLALTSDKPTKLARERVLELTSGNF